MDELVSFFGDTSDTEEDNAEETPFCKWRQRVQSSGAEISTSGLPSFSQHQSSQIAKTQSTSNGATRPSVLHTSTTANTKGKAAKCKTPSSRVKKSPGSSFKDKPMRTSISCVNLQSRGDSVRGGKSLCVTPDMPFVLPPEVEEGNIEYKRQLVNLTTDRFEHLVTQMKWRLAEGSGEAIYELGVTDDGRLAGLDPKELKDSICTLTKMARKLEASTSLLRERRLPDAPDRRAVEILVRRLPQNQTTQDTRVAVLGNVDAGKSTLLGVMTQGELDNGRGRARLNLLRHLHEIQSGRTSSISYELLGFDSAGETVNYSQHRSVEEIVAEASKLVVLIDLAGHHKYQRTTLFGLTSHMPHCAALVVSANKGLVGTSRDHCSLACALNVPVIVVVSKVDLAPPDNAISQVEEWLQSLGVTQPPLKVVTEDDAATAASTLHSDRMTPIFSVSCVTGQGLAALTKFLSLLPSSPDSDPRERAKLLQAPAELWVGQVFTLNNVVGSVLVGILHSGMIHEGDALRLGPLQSGKFLPVVVTSVHRNRMPHRCVQAGQTSSVAVILDQQKGEEGDEWPELCRVARRGMVLLGGSGSGHQDGEEEEAGGLGGPCWSLTAEVTTIRGAGLVRKAQTVLHCANVCQPVIVKEITAHEEDENKSTVVLQFLKSPEYVKIGRTLLFRDSTNQGRGTVIALNPMKQESIVGISEP